MSDPLAIVHDDPEGIEETTELLADVDRSFEHGFGRLSGDAMDSLESLSAAFTGTPLADRLDEAVDAIGESRFEPTAFEAIAAARASLQGARYDALVDHVCDTYGWRRPDVDNPTPQEPDDEVTQLLTSTQQWLGELAIAGFGTLEEDTVAPFESTLRELKAHEETRRLATLLSGFIRELLTNTPTASMGSVPVTRWADCWSRAMIHATKLPGRTEPQTVSGTVRILGADLRHHENVASFVVHGLLESDDDDVAGDGQRLIRTTQTTSKVDAVAGKETWRVFADSATDGPGEMWETTIPAVLKAVTDNQTLEITDAQLYETGDLVLSGDVEAGDDCDKLDLFREWFEQPAETDLVLTSHYPLDRHPVQIAVPAFLEGYDVDADGDGGDGGDNNDHGLPMMTFDDSEATIRMDTERISPHSGMDVEHVIGSKRLGGLLRFDGGQWTVQPLVETKRSKRYYTGMEAEPYASSDLLDGLHERADKLLRDKA